MDEREKKICKAVMAKAWPCCLVEIGIERFIGPGGLHSAEVA